MLQVIQALLQAQYSISCHLHQGVRPSLQNRTRSPDILLYQFWQNVLHMACHSSKVEVVKWPSASEKTGANSALAIFDIPQVYAQP